VVLAVLLVVLLVLVLLVLVHASAMCSKTSA
jgi:hypothetical protein